MLPEGFQSGKTDSFAGRESREFIPFYLGNEANGQPAQRSAENTDLSTVPEVLNPNAAQVTAGSDPTEGALATTQEPSHQTIARELPPSSIEIIEDAGSQTYSVHESSEGTKRRPSHHKRPSVAAATLARLFALSGQYVSLRP